MSNLDIFNLDAESFVTKTNQAGGSKDLEFYKPYPEDGKDGVYKSLIRFIPNSENPAKSKIHKYYVYLNDPVSGNGFAVDCPSTVGKKSILKDLFWKLKNSHSAADQELAKSFSRKEDFYSLVQIVQDKNNPDLEGKIMIFKFGKKINEMIEAQLQPEYGDACNPYDLFEGREFAISVRKVGEWNNYDLCSFVGERTPIKIEGSQMKKNQEDMNKILEYLKTGPRNLSSFDYKDWDDEVNDKVMAVIRNTVPEQRIVNEIVGAVSSAPSKPNPVQQPPVSTPSSSSQMLEEVSNTKVGGQTPKETSYEAPSTSSSTSLDDLYADL
jgi:hypothetical protein